MCHNIIKHSFNENIKELIILKWKTEIFYKFSTLCIFYTPHFPHSAFSTPRIFHTPHFPHPAFSTPRIFHTPHFPHSALRTPRFPLNPRSILLNCQAILPYFSRNGILGRWGTSCCRKIGPNSIFAANSPRSVRFACSTWQRQTFYRSRTDGGYQ